jgi:hypothetical protein
MRSHVSRRRRAEVNEEPEQEQQARPYISFIFISFSLLASHHRVSTLLTPHEDMCAINSLRTRTMMVLHLFDAAFNVGIWLSVRCGRSTLMKSCRATPFTCSMRCTRAWPLRVGRGCTCHTR